jgi:hypothetical protein
MRQREADDEWNSSEITISAAQFRRRMYSGELEKLQKSRKSTHHNKSEGHSNAAL